MTDYREILRLKSLGFNEPNIALSCSCSRIPKTHNFVYARRHWWFTASLREMLAQAPINNKLIMTYSRLSSTNISSKPELHIRHKRRFLKSFRVLNYNQRLLFRTRDSIVQKSTLTLW